MANEALLQHHLAPSTRRDTNPDDYCNPASFKLQGQRQLRLRQALKPMHHHHLTQLDWKSPFIPFRCWKACTCGGNSKGFSNWPRGLENNGLHCNFLGLGSSGPITCVHQSWDVLWRWSSSSLTCLWRLPQTDMSYLHCHSKPLVHTAMLWQACIHKRQYQFPSRRGEHGCNTLIKVQDDGDVYFYYDETLLGIYPALLKPRAL